MKISEENPIESLGFDPEKDKQKTSHWSQIEVFRRSTGRSTSNSQIFDRWVSGRPPGRSCNPNRELCSLMVDRSIDRAQQRLKVFRSVDWSVDWSAHKGTIKSYA